MSARLPDWQKLRAHALAGLGQMPLDAAGDAAEAVLWRQLAVAATARRVGALAPSSPVMPQAAPERSKPICSDEAAQALQAVLNPDYAMLLPEWCDLAAAAGVAPPPLKLPALLDWAGKDPARRAALAPLLGAHECWLAALRPEWRWAVSGAPEREALERIWQEGTDAERRQAFAAMRGIDAAAARTWLLEGWKDCSADLRAGCITALAAALAAEDEPLLEQALDDKRKTVREPARELLSRLPRSAFAARAAAVAAQAFLVQKGGLLRRAKLETAQPKLYPANERDGWDAKRAWTAVDYQELLQRTPLSWWSADCKLDPEEALGLIGEAGEGFAAAMLRAVQQTGDAAWLRAALATVGAESLKQPVVYNPGQPPLSLLSRLPAVERTAPALRLLGLGSNGWWAVALAQALPGPWSGEFSRYYLEYLRGQGQDRLGEGLQLAALRGDTAALAPLFAAGADQPPPGLDDMARNRWRSAWLDALRLFELRNRIHRAFAPAKGD